MLTESLVANQISEMQEIVRSNSCLLPRGAGSKSALQAVGQSVTPLEMSALRGMLEYQPQEFTFTALAGTPLGEIERLLAQNGQYLPFDPPLVERAATLGGTVAAGLSGPGRYRFGGIRDFILGVQFIDGRGELVRAGGKVVKNAAGFDLPKLMVGSLGGFGALVALSFKVFPLPQAFMTLRFHYESLSPALEAITRLGCSPLEIFALELALHECEANLLIRLGGDPRGFAARRERLRLVLGCEAAEVLENQPEREFWRRQREFAWLDPAQSLVKIPLPPRLAPALDERLAGRGAQRRYSAGANLAWVGWPGDLGDLDLPLKDMGLPALAVLGAASQVRLGARLGAAFEARVKQALDPAGKWLEL